MSYEILIINAMSPGQVFRYFERSHRLIPSVKSLLLSDGVGNSSIRCLSARDLTTDTSSFIDSMRACGPSISEAFPPRVTLLWRHASAFPELAKWGFTVWENGEVKETSEHILPPEPKPSLLSRLPGMKRNLPHPSDIAWALARGLPIDRVPAAGLCRNIPIIDYATVAQLDQRSLLVENSPRLYSFPL